MGFVVTSERKADPVRYEKVGRLLPGENDEIRVMVDGFGEVFRIHRADFVILSGGLCPSGMRLSDSGSRVILSGPKGEEYVVLSRQVRGMMEGWPKKKAAVFIIPT
ncbi:MAG: hypothetical protein GXY48_05315 [Methanomicrobiales archaeon]|nr:hypothetical protein [Methanomicrobiales archaeon]